MSNWRDDARELAPAPESRDEHEPAEWRDKPALPEFRHQPAAERAPTIPPPPAEPTETRLSRAQLRDRIHQMEHTQRTRDGRPSDQRNRADKIYRYQTELARKDADAAADQSRAAEHRAQEDARRDEHDTTSQAAQATAETESRARIEAYKADLRAAAQRNAPVATAAEYPPVPPAAAADLAEAGAKRARIVATAHAETLSTLDCAVEALVCEHTAGAVIDAAWAAAKRIFRPNGGAR